ncbi:GNAT family N-acetyltransferase [Streptomyces sp. NPDC059740]|uniref:GNAT family N-acetyltransferase n=1 Tax=Streptomyces sp. NPDC059740 TaxID=3346926 RepID=UPI00364A3391
MSAVRPARPEDAPELVRLRRLMFAAMQGRDEPGPWEESAVRMTAEQLAAPTPVLGAFVVDADSPGPDGRPRLAACAVGRLEERLPAPGHPSGRFGFVFNVCTDTGHRGRGYARATTRALLEWLAERGASRVDLHATGEAESMYRSMGFAEHSTALSLDVRELLRERP